MSEYPSTATPAKHFISLENSLYLAAFSFALFLRFFQLGKAPLNDIEAGWAIQALDIVRGAAPVQIGSQPGYVILTSALFFFFKEANALARFLPALAGSLLVCLPLILRPLFEKNPRLRTAGIILAFALAADPALVLLSRTAGSSMPAISFTLYALALYCCGRWINSRFFGAAAVFGALALLSGPDLIAGLVALGLTGLAGLAFGLNGALASQQGEKQLHTWGQVNWLIGVLTLGLVGTGFLLLPQGAAGFARSLPEYLASWVSPSGIPAARLLAAVLLYQPIALLLGFVGGLRGWLYSAEDSDEVVPVVSRLLSIWAVLALLLPMLQAGRQVSVMAWGLIPLWSLAAIELAHQGLSENNRSRLKVALTGALVIGVFLLMGIYYGLYMSSLDVNNMQELLLISGIVLMAVIVVILVGIGWDFEIARCSSVWSVTTILFAYMLATTWGMGIRQPNNPADLWSSGSTIGQSQELLETLHLLSSYKTGQKTSLDIVSINPTPSLRWALRSFINASSQGALGQNQMPSAIITDTNEKSPALLAIYRGQDFDWQVSPGWVTTLPPDLRRWIYNHKAPTVSVRITLWIRGDVFPGGTLNQPSAAPAANP